ncbi:MAG: hypothetical protein ACUVUG_03845 [Candidatus Aminicenantia bacterium]
MGEAIAFPYPGKPEAKYLLQTQRPGTIRRLPHIFYNLNYLQTIHLAPRSPPGNRGLFLQRQLIQLPDGILSVVFTNFTKLIQNLSF